MSKTAAFVLSIVGVLAAVALHFASEPDSESRQSSKLAPKAASGNDARLNSFFAILARRGALGQKEAQLWRQACSRLASKPDDGTCLFLRGSLMLTYHVLEYALADANRLVDVEGGSARAYWLRGAIYEADGDLQEAQSDYTRAIIADPLCGDAYYGRARVHLKAGSPALAAADLEKCTSAKFFRPILPERVNACPESVLYLLGQAYEGTNERENALHAYQKYLSYMQVAGPVKGICDESYDMADKAKQRIDVIVPESLSR